MNLKKIKFEKKESTLLYEDYLNQIIKATKKLGSEDQNDILMELNSHIYESICKKQISDETENLQSTLLKIGDPKEILKPLIAEKKLNQARRTLNPIHIFHALFLNFTNGILYAFLFVLYLLLISFVLLIFGKIIFPNHVGFYYKENLIFMFGAFKQSSKFDQYEILGNWFIPFTIILCCILYLSITLFIKIKSKINSSVVKIA